MVEKARIPGVIEGRGSSLVPLPQAQDSTKESICVRDTETGSEGQNFLENHILSAHSAKGDPWKVPQEDTSREKKRVTRTGGKKPLKIIQVVVRKGTLGSPYHPSASRPGGRAHLGARLQQ